MLIKLHRENNAAVFINPDFIVEVLEYSRASNDEKSLKSSIVFNAAGHSALSIDVVETPDQIAKMCNPIMSTMNKTTSSVKSCFNKIFKTNE